MLLWRKGLLIFQNLKEEVKMEQTLKKPSLLSLYFLGARAKTLTASAYPVILGMVLARFDGSYNIYLYLCTIFTAVFLQIGCNLANDYYDGKEGRDTKNRKGPKRLSSSGVIEKSMLFSFMAVSFMICIISCIPLIQAGGRQIFYMLSLGIFLAIFYTKGKYSLANTGLASPVVLLVFGPIATAYCYFFQTGMFSAKAALFGFLPGSLSMMMFAMNNLRDIEEDRQANKNTLVVRFGFTYGKLEFFFFLLTSMLLPLFLAYYYSHPVITLLPCALFVVAYKIAYSVHIAKDSNDIIALFPKVARFNIFYSLLSIIGWRIASL